MLILEIAVGVFLGQLAFSLVGMLIRRAQTKRERAELEGLIGQLQGLGEQAGGDSQYVNEFTQDADNLVGV